MATVLVDANVLLDILIPDPVWEEWSSEALADAAEWALLTINPIIYGEVSVGFRRIEDLDAALPEDLRREPLPWDGAFLAGKAFLAHRRRRGSGYRTLPDFFIGAHAAIKGYTLLTRDPRRFRAYFPSLRIIHP
jgi:predicted nucleic acid-binding protein